MDGYIGMRVWLPPVNGEEWNGAPMRQPHPSQVGKHGTIGAFESVKIFGHRIMVPVITLDDGTVIRGYECWWEPEMK